MRRGILREWLKISRDMRIIHMTNLRGDPNCLNKYHVSYFIFLVTSANVERSVKYSDFSMEFGEQGAVSVFTAGLFYYAKHTFWKAVFRVEQYSHSLF